MTGKINWLKIESEVRRELKETATNSIVIPNTETDIEQLREALKIARETLLKIDLILGDETGRGYEIENYAPAGWV